MHGRDEERGVGVLLRTHRRAVGLTQAQLADQTGLSVRGIQDLERGRSVPQRETLERLIHGLRLDGERRGVFEAAARPRPRRHARDTVSGQVDASGYLLRPLSSAIGPEPELEVRLPAELGQLSADEAGALFPFGHNGSRAVNESTARHNLPRQLSSFVGRTQEFVEVHHLSERTPLLTLVGPGGVGKTRLALEVAACCVDHVADGVWLVELASLTDPALVPQRVAAAFGIPERGRGSLVARLRDVLGRRQLLLVLDNCEHLVAACAEITEALLRACPRTRVLATSREPLGITGEHLWPVAPLSVVDEARGLPSEAVQLFVERAVAAAPSFALTDANRQAIVEICAHLDGIPLAIELAAARVKTFTPAQIATRLGDRFRLLVGGSRTAPQRQQTLQATLAWSYELLGPDDRRLFEQLAVFSGDWDLEAAEQVCTDEATAPANMLNGLERLVDRSLVLAQHGRYWLLETVREYALERLRESVAVGALREHHATYYLHLAEAAEPELKRSDQAAWFERLACEHDNFRAVLRWSLDEGSLEVGLRLATALYRFWEVRGHWSEARRWLLDLLGAPGAADQPTHLCAAAVAHAGGFAHMLGDQVAARRLSNEALQLARTVGAQATAAFALHTLGQILLHEDEPAAARPLLQESLALARHLGDGWATARVLSNLSSVAREEGDIALARSLADEGVAVAQRAGERRIASTILINLASLGRWATVDDLAAARTCLEDALAIKRELGDRAGVGWVLHGLGWIAFEGGDDLTACQHFCAALAIARDLGVADRAGIDRPSTLAGLACVALRFGDAERALRLFAADARIAEAGGIPYAMYLSERRRPWLEVAREHLGQAAERVWSAGWALAPGDLETEASALAMIVSADSDALPPQNAC